MDRSCCLLERHKDSEGGSNLIQGSGGRCQAGRRRSGDLRCGNRSADTRHSRQGSLRRPPAARDRNLPRCDPLRPALRGHAPLAYCAVKVGQLWWSNIADDGRSSLGADGWVSTLRTGIRCLQALTPPDLGTPPTWSSNGSVQSLQGRFGDVASARLDDELLHCRLNVSEGVRDPQFATHAFEHEDDQYTADDAQDRAYAPGQVVAVSRGD